MKDIINFIRWNKVKDTKNKKNKNYKEENQKINALKKQNILYNITIKENENKLSKLRNKHKQKLFKELLNSIQEKENEIGDVFQKWEDLNYALFKTNTKIKYYNLHCEQFNKDKNQMEEKIKSMNKMEKENEGYINEYTEKIGVLNNMQKDLDKEVESKKKEKNDLADEKTRLIEEIENNKIYIEEREKNNKMIKSLDTEQNKLQNEINRLINKGNIITISNSKYLVTVKNNEDQMQILIKNSEESKKNQERIKTLQNNIKSIIPNTPIYPMAPYFI